MWPPQSLPRSLHLIKSCSTLYVDEWLNTSHKTPQHQHQVQRIESLTSVVRLSRPCLTHSLNFSNRYSVSVENSSNRLIFRKNRHFFSKKNGRKTGKKNFSRKKTGALKFCFSFFLAVFTVLQVHPKTRLSITWPRELLLLWFMRFSVINYLGGKLTLNVDKITKKRAKSQKNGQKTGDFPKTPV